MTSPVALLLGLLSVLSLFGVHSVEAQNATWCWGTRDRGALGDGEYYGRSNVPVKVQGDHSFTAVCTGAVFACGLEPSGKAWCWGNNGGGQIGDGTNTDRATPVAVVGGHTFSAITCGGGHTCTLDQEGQAWCWGDNQWGPLGAPVVDSWTPVKAAMGYTFASLCAGSGYTCGLQADGRMFCWGLNENKQLGTVNAGLNSTAPVLVDGDHTFLAMSCGTYHVCALDDGRKAWCWGDGRSGQLGNGGRDSYPASPVPVSGGRTYTDISAGLFHTCAVEADSSLWCWGKAVGVEQLSTSVPKLLAEGRNYVAVGVGDANGEGSEVTCGLDTSGDLWCFGSNGNDQLGSGSSDDSPETPVKVAGGQTFLSFDASTSGHTCAIATRQLPPGEISPSAMPSTAPSPVPSTAPPPVPSTAPSTATAQPPADSNATGSSGGSLSSSSPSSAPVGAIVGGIVGAAAVLAVLAFFALRPGKGWLRRKPAAAATAAAAAGCSKWGKEMSTAGSSTAGSSAAPGGQPATGGTSAAPLPAAAASPLQAIWTSSSLGHDTFLPYSRAPPSSLAEPDTLLPYSRAAGAPPISQAGVSAPTEPAAAPPSSMSGAGWPAGQPTPQPLPPSYISSAGLPTAPAAGGAALAGMTASYSSGSQSIPSDPALSFVTSHLGAHTAAAAQQQQPTALTPGSSGGSGALELRSEARVWEVQWQELKLQRLLGRGSFGSVYLAEWNQVPVAVKMLGGKDGFDLGQLELPDWLLQELQAEAAVMSRMRHPNIVQFMGLVAVPPAIITEYCSRGSLYDCLAAARKQAAAADLLTWRRRLGMAIDAGAGLLYLHRRSIIHRDIKSPNLLVDAHWTVKVADFNLSKLLEGPNNDTIVSSVGANNPIWLAPEVLEGHRATAASDLYSFGMVLYELLTWRLPWSFADMTAYQVGSTIVAGGRPEVPAREALPGPDTAAWAGLDAYVQLMRDCWAQRPADRPSFDELVGRLRRLLADTPGS